MITEIKVTELFCIADDFCKFFYAKIEKIHSETGKQAETKRVRMR